MKMDYIIEFCKLELGWVRIAFCDEAAAMWYYMKWRYFLNTKLYSANRHWYSDGMETVTHDISQIQEVFRFQHKIGRKSHIVPKLISL